MHQVQVLYDQLIFKLDQEFQLQHLQYKGLKQQ